MTGKLRCHINGQGVTAYWEWPKNRNLTILQVRTTFTKEPIEVDAEMYQVLYAEIVESISDYEY